MKYFHSNSLEETERIAAEWVSSLKEGINLVGLSGHLGAGKTAFVKAVGKTLGVKEDITSPTFVIMKIYDTKDERFKRLVHIDAYRLENQKELDVLNLESLVSNENNLIMIEWPENVGMKNFDAGAHLKFEIREGSYDISVV